MIVSPSGEAINGDDEDEQEDGVDESSMGSLKWSREYGRNNEYKGMLREIRCVLMR